MTNHLWTRALHFVSCMGVWMLAVPGLLAASVANPAAISPDMAHRAMAVQMPFISNQGQTDSRIKFYTRMFAGTVLVEETGQLTYVLAKYEAGTWVREVVLREKLLNGRPAEVQGENPAATQFNYFSGRDSSRWHTGISSYNTVRLGEVYEGIEIRLQARENNVEKLFHVMPGAEVNQIRLELQGGSDMRVADNGELEILTDQGPVRFSRPLAFQGNGDTRRSVDVAYVVDGQEYGFKVGTYDRNEELIIDPILSATFISGYVEDYVATMALDGAGNVYVAGPTMSWPGQSLSFPGVGPSSADSTQVNVEGFVAKLSPDLSKVLAATFLGGSGAEYFAEYSLAIDKDGNVFVGGTTQSPDFPGVGSQSADPTSSMSTTFPPNVYNEGLGGDVFVAKLNPDLSSLLAATFLGGNKGARFGDLVLDKDGNVYVTGVAASDDFPGINSASADSTFAVSEVFVAKLNSNLSSILAATFLGGSGPEGAYDRTLPVITRDVPGNIFVAGFTASADFPGVGPSSLDRTFSYPETFVAKLNPGLTAVLAATFLGGAASGDEPNDIAIDHHGNVLVAGTVSYDSSGFPAVSHASAQGTRANQGYDLFVVKLSPDLRSALAATYLAGSRDEHWQSGSITIDAHDDIYVTGTTLSTDFPGIGAASEDGQFTSSRSDVFGPISTEGFLVKLSSDLRFILGSTYLGGAQSESMYAVVLNNTGQLYVAGGTGSDDFPGIGPWSAVSSSGIATRGVVVKLDVNSWPTSSQIELLNNRVSFTIQSVALNPSPEPAAPAGVYTLNARLTNVSSQYIPGPVKAVVKTLTNNNLLLSATEGNRGVASRQDIGIGPDNVLTPGESIPVQLKIGLANRNGFSFFVDVISIH